MDVSNKHDKKGVSINFGENFYQSFLNLMAFIYSCLEFMKKNT